MPHTPLSASAPPSLPADLVGLPLLQDLPDELIRHLARHGIPADGRQRKLLFLRGDPDSFVGLVLRGGVYHSLQEPDGHEVIMDRTLPGEMVGESALLRPERRSCNALLGRNSLLLLLHQQHFAPLQACAPLISRIQQQLCARLQRISSFVETVCLYRLEARLARHLLAEMALNGRPSSGGTLLPMPANQGTLAAMLNASRPRLNAQLKQWQRDGLIQLTRHALQIRDPARLLRIARQDGQINPKT